MKEEESPFISKLSGKSKQTFMLLGLSNDRQIAEIEKLYFDGIENGEIDIQLRIIHFELGILDVDTVPPAIFDIKTFDLSKLKKNKCIIPKIKFDVKNNTDD